MVDLIVRGKNGHEKTEACVKSIRDNTPEGAYRLILVDDGSDPPYNCADADYHVRSRKNHGSVTAINLGLQVSLSLDGDYVAIFDNDTRVPDGDTDWLRRFVRELEEYPDTACVGATTNFANRPQHILSVPQTYTGDWKDERAGKSGAKENPGVVWFVSFACLLKKAAVRQCGLWDEQYNPGNWEDTDYAMQLRTNGWQIRVARSVYIHHDGHSTFSDDLARLMQVNQAKFVEKWGMGRLVDLGVVPREALTQEASA